MVVQHNLTAMNSNRMLGITQNLQAKSSEKLSSGYRINRAADDAAGLSISEKMRKQINGLDQASSNAQDGVSAVQTAEGALTEVHSMLQRMNELAVQASNGTNSEKDRAAIQAEIEQLTTEIDRVAETTKFNETYLLKGDNGKKTVALEAHDAGLAGKITNNGDGTATFTMESLKVGDEISIGGKFYTIGTNDADVKQMITDNAAADGAKADVVIGDTTYKYSAAAGAGNGTAADNHAEGWYAVGVDDALVYTTTYTATTLGDEVEKGATVKIGTDEYKVMKDTTTAGVDDVDSTLITKDKACELAAAELLKANQIGDTKNTAAVTNADATEAKAAVFTKANGDAVDNIFASGFGIVGAGSLASSATTGAAVTLTGDYTGSSNLSLVYTDGTETNSHTNAVTIAAGWYTTTDLAALKADTTQDNNNSPDLTGIATAKVSGATGTIDDVTIGGSATKGDTITLTAATTGSYTAFTTVAEMEEALADGKDIKKGNASTAATAADYKYEAAVAASDGTANGTFKITLGSSEVANTLSFNLHVGADADMTNKIQVDLEAMTSEYLGIKDINVTDNTGMAATYAVDAIQDAIQKISSQRSALGAVQNRLEHTIANLDNVVENTTAAESRIRDTDMAEEMVEYSKNNILAQAGQSMLAQANQSTQGVLSLLG